MQLDSARLWLIKASLSATALAFCFFIVAPACGYPLRFDQSFKLLEIILPVFVGYLGSATQFVFSKHEPVGPEVHGQRAAFVGLLVRGPILVFSLGLVSAVVAFGITNRPGAPAGTGMSVDALSGIVTAALSLQAASTGAIVSYLFSVRN